MLAEPKQERFSMAKGKVTPVTTAPAMPSIEEMRALVAAHEAAEKAAAAAAKEAAKKAVGRPKLSGERAQNTFHVLISDMTEMRVLAAKTNTPISALLDQAMFLLFEKYGC
jgi:hypothetical protein